MTNREWAQKAFVALNRFGADELWFGEGDVDTLEALFAEHAAEVREETAAVVEAASYIANLFTHASRSKEEEDDRASAMHQAMHELVSALTNRTA